MAKNFWGDLSSLEKVETPKTILEEQASLLTKVTGGLLVGAVEDQEADYHGRFQHDLNVVVPALNNYRYTILSVRYPLDLYPLELRAARPKVVITEINNQEEFEEAIGTVLSSPEVRSALSHLRSQVG